MQRYAFFALLLMAACSQESKPAPQEIASTEAAPISADAVAANTSAKFAAPVSRYTSLKDCKALKSGESVGEDWSVSRCAGLGGFDLQINYGDARDDLALLDHGKPAADLKLVELSGGGFSSLANTAEWRGSGDGAAFLPTALIVRHLVSENAGNAEKQAAVLMVIDLAQRCVIAQVRPQAGQNETARAIADGPRQACLRQS